MSMAKRFVLCAVLCMLASWSPVIGDDVVLKPIAGKSGMKEVGLVFIQGAQIEPQQYLPLVQEAQKASPFAVWVGIPDFAFDIPEPFDISGGIDRILQSMKDSGMTTSDIVFAAHSLGGVMLQDYLNNNKEAGIGQILLGSFLLRKYRNASYPVPTLTIGGELDGLCRVTRIMESYYHRILHAGDQQAAIKTFPVAVVEGMSHMQFASGDIPLLLKLRDLKPEISYDDAHKAVAGLMTAFMSVRVDGNSTALSALTHAIQNTEKFLKPIIAAYELEGFYNFKKPCYDAPPSPACTLGCPWTERAQQTMGGLKEARLNDTDTFHPVWQIDPDHLPHILNNCTSPTPSCVLKSITISQCVYDEMDKLDTGFVSTSAYEIRAKLKSRQAVMEAAGHRNVNFNTSDGPSICKVINQQAYTWALLNAGTHTADRFRMVGVAMVMGEDKGPYNTGPLWIWSPISYSEGKNATGGVTEEIRSVMMRTPVDYFIKAAAGFHYCKLLSPARATEWIYVDGLRTYYGINN